MNRRLTMIGFNNDELRRLRARDEKSYRQLSNSISGELGVDITITHLARLETGLIQPRLDTAVYLAKYFDVPLESLVCFE